MYATALLTLALAGCREPSSEGGGTHGVTRIAASVRSAKSSSSSRVRAHRLPVDTEFGVRLDRALSSAHNRAGDPFAATLEEAVVVERAEVLPRGTIFTGRITATRTKPRAVLALTLDGFAIAGRQYPIVTALEARTTDALAKRNVELIAGGPGLGALIASAAKESRVLTASAGAPSTGSVRTPAVDVPANTPFRFLLKSSVSVVVD